MSASNESQDSDSTDTRLHETSLENGNLTTSGLQVENTTPSQSFLNNRLDQPQDASAGSNSFVFPQTTPTTFRKRKVHDESGNNGNNVPSKSVQKKNAEKADENEQARVSKKVLALLS